jgi:predicted transcriptional regulator
MNWPHIIDELRSRGWTQVLLAARLGVVQSAISELRTGGTKDPKHSTGRALLELLASGELPPAAELADVTKAAA